MDTIVMTNELTEELLNDLIQGRIRVIKIPEFYPKEESQRLAEDVLTRKQKAKSYRAVRTKNGERELLDYGVSLLGAKSNTATGTSQDSPEWNTYVKDRDAFAEVLEEMHQQGTTPIEQIIAICNELHEHGAECAKFYDIEASTGGFRLTYPGKMLELKPHVDTPREEIAVDSNTFAINVYLSIPRVGRELMLWPAEQTFQESEYTDHESYIAHVMESVEPIIVPLTAGDAVFFNSSLPHGVKAFEGDIPSIAQQTFFVAPAGKPLQFYN